MAKTATEIFNDKVSLIYEYNKKSPLFARMANTEIENNNIEKAIEILNKGIEIYPNYSAAYLLLGKANVLIGNYSSALKYIRKGSDLIHSKKTYDYYLKELENVKKQRSFFQKSTRTSFLSQPELNEIEPILFEDENRDGKVKETVKSVEDRLDNFAIEITNAKISDVSDDEVLSNALMDDFPSDNLIVSETLAKIYAAQGEQNEAIKVYEKLIVKEPQKAKYYNKKISELKSELEL
ncbi:MAG: tetratricopeptide repeat protein [Bacteroidetes bacterium]|nr:tetratricopeptide repeat protein [Bacteroidota bacterium]